MKIFMGIDQSFTNSGIVIMDESGDVKYFTTIKTKKDVDGDIFDRAITISSNLIEVIQKYDPTTLSLEGLAFSKFGNATRDLAGLQAVIITRIRNETKYGSRLLIVSPNLLKKFATEKGGASKQDMVDFLPKNVLESFAEAKFKKTTGLYDLADAYHLAKYSLAHNQKTTQK